MKVAILPPDAFPTHMMTGMFWLFAFFTDVVIAVLSFGSIARTLTPSPISWSIADCCDGASGASPNLI